MEQVDVGVSGRNYSIRIENGLFGLLPGLLAQRHAGRKLAVVCDDTVQALYGNRLTDALVREGLEAFVVPFPAGESHKTLQTLTGLYGELAQRRFTRSDVVVALGGGVTGDMAGLAAATFLRGTAFIQIPTTLLAMVDSSIGGKVAVDLPQGKNLVGAFYQPHAVYTDPSLLDSLPDRQFANGMAELVKHGFLFDASLVDRIAAMGSRASLHPQMEALIAESCDWKRKVVEQDERDEGPRQLLNFGHTLGHAIEKVTGFTEIAHGEAISIGMCVFSRMARARGWSEPGTAERVEAALAAVGLPTELPALDAGRLFDAMTLDKKARSGAITIVTLDRIGVARLRTLTIPELKEALDGHLHG